MDRVSPDVLREVERVLERKLSTLASEDYTTAGGIDSVVEILNNVDREQKKTIIEALEEEDPNWQKKSKTYVRIRRYRITRRPCDSKVMREVDNRACQKLSSQSTRSAREDFQEHVQACGLIYSEKIWTLWVLSG